MDYSGEFGEEPSVKTREVQTFGPQVSHDAATSKMGKVDIDIRFAAKLQGLDARAPGPILAILRCYEARRNNPLVA